jgi:hypothetical protein
MSRRNFSPPAGSRLDLPLSLNFGRRRSLQLRMGINLADVIVGEQGDVYESCLYPFIDAKT